MPTLQFVGNAGRFRLTGSGVDVAQGETVTVDADTAEYLQANGEFEVVNADDAGSDNQGDSVDEQIDAGECPWCDDYEGDAVAQHASSAHPDEWTDFTED